MNGIRTCFLLLLTLAITPLAAAAQNSPLATAIAKVAAVKNNGYGHEDAIAGWKLLGSGSINDVPAILAAIEADRPLAANWLRSAVDQILERHASSGGQLPADALEKIVFDTSYAPRARRLAYEWLKTADDSAEARIIPKMLHDSSLEMRRDAVALAIDQAKQQEQGPQAIAAYEKALVAARDFDQVEEIEKALTDLGKEVDLQKHFGFLVNWQLIGPFDNTDKGGFDVPYGPEEDLASKPGYPGKSKQEVTWNDHETTHKYGEVDLNTAIGKHMGAAGYAYTEYQSPTEQPAELRLVSRNANKIWVNGELVMANEVYHSGSKFDQYIAQVALKPGKNTVLVKICQNEQEDSWAQSWAFQLRVCDSLGTALAPSPEKRNASE